MKRFIYEAIAVLLQCQRKAAPPPVALERDAKKWAPVFRKNPALNIGIDHVYEFGLTQSKLIVI